MNELFTLYKSNYYWSLLASQATPIKKVGLKTASNQISLFAVTYPWCVTIQRWKSILIQNGARGKW